MIHDGGSRSYKIGGLNTRAFNEAQPFKSEGQQVIPQMCWTCDATREHTFKILSTTERNDILKSQRPKRHKGRPAEQVSSVFDQLFGNV